MHHSVELIDTKIRVTMTSSMPASKDSLVPPVAMPIDSTQEGRQQRSGHLHGDQGVGAFWRLSDEIGLNVLNF